MNELKSKDSMMNSLKNSVADALIGFKNEGLTVTRKAGRVYVSMDEKLLFPSGSFAINPRGKEALVKLAKLLENKQDINIIVEGHTDTIPYKANGNIDDNWDLSAKRATTIVRIFQQNSKINPLRITAAGRGEFLPIESNNTKEGRAKNRRTEIILMPDLDKLYQIVQ
jgi:chemotaxis protein MotB